MKILVMGAGAIGSYLGAKLKLAGENYFTDRGEHLHALKANGLRMRGPEGEQTVSIRRRIVLRNLRLMTSCSSA